MTLHQASPVLGSTLLGNISPEQFLAEYWQKKPLLIKNAIPDFQGLLTPDELAGLACEEEVQSRIVEEIHGKWHVSHGPFSEEDFSRLPDQPDTEHRWTLLVQSVNHFIPEASALLQQFSFIPHARLDDLMVSYAPDGGGVGPHFDSYDVFLLQGQGKRLWRISAQTDLTLVENAPLRILKNFETSQEWLLNAGDMLYLPPHLAHWGIAVSNGSEDCMTYSIGFRAPKHRELATEFLGYLQDKLQQDENAMPGIYQDADLTLQSHAAEISTNMIAKVSQTLNQIQWSNDVVADFLGRYLSEPKPDVLFEPNKKLSTAQFHKKILQLGLMLDLKSQMLFATENFYLNGEVFIATPSQATLLRQLADTRKINDASLSGADESLLAQLHHWYLSGYLQIGNDV
ncbi:MAG: cupin domain-containing protein [Methylotenera sp.]